MREKQQMKLRTLVQSELYALLPLSTAADYIERGYG